MQKDRTDIAAQIQNAGAFFKRKAARQRALHAALAEATEHALTDPLTGLPNRRYLDDVFNRKRAELRRHPERQHHALVVLDGDGFKKINDTYGHNIGDQMIKHMASALKTSLRDDDFLARIGGDEFAIILSEVGTKEKAQEIVVKLQERLEDKHPFSIDSGSGQQITIPLKISMGVVLFPVPAETENFTMTFKKADAALYVNKQERKRGDGVVSRAKYLLKQQLIRFANTL